MEKSIVAKLNLQKFEQIAVWKQPAGSDYFAELTGYDTTLDKPGYDLIFAFVLEMSELQNLVNQVIERGLLHPNGYLYAAYPKKGNKVYPTFIHRDDLLAGLSSDEQGYIGTSTIKFARMVGLDDVFTVVGFKEDAAGKGKTSSQSSQRVDDYIAFIPAVEKDLTDEPALLAFYQSLTQGYRKDWARYVYSAKQEDTQAKRREEMKDILRLGFKSRELYRQSLASRP
ncbi:YdeI/OmpD-associated family protein [Paenibacillus filicis]|uniref:YdeI/OmpD-associated family protein n=2 Tax=Paenibacillus filicis TaxID=669464 RepID=A0ABU9DNT7_9BACL